jgi:hypothetical protein
MASRAPAYRTAPLDVLLASVPSLPRPILARLTARMIDRLDELDGDADDEPEEDRCDAGDDEIAAGVAPAFRSWPMRSRPGDDDDAEPVFAAAFQRNQSPRPAARYDAAALNRRLTTKFVGAGNVGLLVPIGRPGSGLY